MSQDAANADQIAYWNNSVGQTWADLQDLLDRQIEPLGLRAMAAAAPKPGERVLDIGCGCGQTSLALAQAVGPSGAVTGVDISAPMLEVARRRVGDRAQFLEADAQTYAFAPGGFDLAYSRFGVMFFADPVAAFANIGRGLASGGRLGFVCWRPMAQNAWMAAPLEAARAVLPPIPPPTDPFAPGPFAFADADRVRGILEQAGFVDIEITPHDQPIGGHGLDDAVALSLKVGPVAAVLRESPEYREPAARAVRAAFAPMAGDDGVYFGSATWIVTARRP